MVTWSWVVWKVPSSGCDVAGHPDDLWKSAVDFVVCCFAGSCTPVVSAAQPAPLMWAKRPCCPPCCQLRCLQPAGSSAPPALSGPPVLAEKPTWGGADGPCDESSSSSRSCFCRGRTRKSNPPEPSQIWRIGCRRTRPGQFPVELQPSLRWCQNDWQATWQWNVDMVGSLPKALPADAPDAGALGPGIAWNQSRATLEPTAPQAWRPQTPVWAGPNVYRFQRPAISTLTDPTVMSQNKKVNRQVNAQHAKGQTLL